MLKKKNNNKNYNLLLAKNEIKTEQEAVYNKQ